MITCNNNPSVCLPPDALELIFKRLAPKDLGVCASINTAWKNVANQEKFWACLITEKQRTAGAPGLGSKQIFINQNKSKFFSIFSKELIDAFGGMEKAKSLPYLSFNEPRVLANGIIDVSELNSPLTVGRFSSIPMQKKNKPIESSDISRYTFLAIRFINREFDPYCTEKDVNIWITKEGSWMLLSGGQIGGWPTRFPSAKGSGEDFSRTIEYIGRLVKGEPCGIRDSGNIVHTPSNLGNYFQRDDRAHLISKENILPPATLSKILRSGSSKEDILEAIKKTDPITQENLCDALDRELDLSLFQALVSNIAKIEMSVLTCALYQDRINELGVIIDSGKVSSIDPKSLFEKAKSNQMRDFLIATYPEANLQKPVPSAIQPVPAYMIYKESLTSAEHEIIRINKISADLRQKAIDAINERAFETVRFCWDAIPDQKKRREVLSELFKICFQLEEREAYECLVKMSTMEKDHFLRNALLCQLIDLCQKLQDNEMGKDISMLALSNISDYYLKMQYKKKLGLEFQ